MQISLTPFCGHERDSTKMYFCNAHIVLDQTVSAFSGKYFLLSFKHFCSKCTKNPALTTTPTTPWHLLEPKLELLIYSVFPPILFCARPWSELKSWCTFQKQLSLCSTVGLVVLAVSPTEALSTSIFSRLLPSKKSGEKKFNSKMYLARAADFNSLWKCPIQLDPFLQGIFCCLCRVHYSTTNKSHRFDFFRISATVIYHKQVPSNYSVTIFKFLQSALVFAWSSLLIFNLFPPQVITSNICHPLVFTPTPIQLHLRFHLSASSCRDFKNTCHCIPPNELRLFLGVSLDNLYCMAMPYYDIQSIRCMLCCAICKKFFDNSKPCIKLRIELYALL